MVGVFGNVHDCLFPAADDQNKQTNTTALCIQEKKPTRIQFQIVPHPYTMSVSEALSKVQKLVSEEASGNKDAHADLLKAIRELQLAAETPLETTSRVNFQVSR